MNGRHRATARGGFTLIELLVVISVIAILASLAVSFGLGIMAQGQVQKTKANMALLMTAVQNYYDVEGDTYPSGANDGTLFTQLESAPDSAGVIQKMESQSYTDKIFRDGFGNALAYEPNKGLGGQTPLLTSGGPDGKMDLATPNDPVNDDNITSAQ